MPSITSTEKLLVALKQANAPAKMVVYASGGGYNDYESFSATPCADLVRDLTKAGLMELAERAKNGEFDATTEESDAWAKSVENDPELGPLMKKLGLGPK